MAIKLTFQEWKDLPETPFGDIADLSSDSNIKITGYTVGDSFSTRGPSVAYQPERTLNPIELIASKLVLGLPFKSAATHGMDTMLYEQRYDDRNLLPDYSIFGEAILVNARRFREGDLPDLARRLDVIAKQGDPITVGGIYNPETSMLGKIDLKYVRAGNLERIL